jgi:predicted CXXCH cytochrome family protein
MDDPAPAAEYVGAATCATCHEAETAAWQGSHHDLAMDTATETTVLGDFDDASFTWAGVTSRFYRENGDFFVETDGPDGSLQSYEVGYTFGVEPLQQYLVPFPGGRYQALSLAWDSRPDEEGGQRWFHLLPEDTPSAGDELHWTGRTMKWNYMCAECHSTNLMKGYDAESRSYSTTWSDIDVSCESCHGPGSLHAETGAAWPDDAVATPTGGWAFAGGEPIAQRTDALPDRRQVETCAHCHARRSTIEEGRLPGTSIHDSDLVSRLDEGLYHADGQILDEVYVYGSFVQSRMYAAGVRCSDCHDPHTLELKQPGNAVCAQCHLPAVFDTPDHHNHPTGSTGAQCAECHMPAQTYMVVDPRRDHSMRIPRPHLTAELGTPNACSSCHVAESVTWAVDAVEAWYGPPAEEDEARMAAARAIHAGRQGAPESGPGLRSLAADATESGIARATALALFTAHPTQETLDALAVAARDPDPMVRRGALAGLEAFAPEVRLPVAFPLLRDSTRAVRIEAARLLAPLARGTLTDAQQSLLLDVSDEYVAAQRVNQDHPAALTNLGNFHAAAQMPFDAELAYREAIEIDPSYVPAYANLADLYRAMRRDGDGEATLEQALAAVPGHPTLLHARGLLRVRLNRMDEALADLDAAARGAPEEPRYAYVLAIALNSTGDIDRALATIDDALVRHVDDVELLTLAASILRDAGRPAEAQAYLDRLPPA